MLFYHTKYVIRKQQMKKQQNVDVDGEENLGLDEEVQDNEEEAQDNEENWITEKRSVQRSVQKCILV